jgi:hypothetical protein
LFPFCHAGSLAQLCYSRQGETRLPWLFRVGNHLSEFSHFRKRFMESNLSVIQTLFQRVEITTRYSPTGTPCSVSFIHFLHIRMGTHWILLASYCSRHTCIKMKHQHIARKKDYHPSDIKVSRARSRAHLQLAIALQDPKIRFSRRTLYIRKTEFSLCISSSYTAHTSLTGSLKTLFITPSATQMDCNASRRPPAPESREY